MGGFIALFQGLKNKNKDRKDAESEPRDRNALATPAERQAMPTYETDARKAALRDLSGDGTGDDTRAAFSGLQMQQPQAQPPRETSGAAMSEHEAARARMRSMFSNTAPRRY